MEYIEYEYNFGEFKTFLEDHKGVLYDEDYLHYVSIAIQYHNKKVITYIITNDLLETRTWNNHIALLFEYEMKECLELLLTKDIDINSVCEQNTLLDYLLISIICNKDNFKEKLLYVLYIIDNGGKFNIEQFCKQIETGIITEDNLSNIVCIVDILLIYNLINTKINDDNEEVKLVFSNINKNCEEIIDQLDKNIICIFYEYYNINNKNDLFICINKLSIINKSGWSDDDLFIYFDTKNNWCFGKEDVKYIKNTKMNPLNDTLIPDYIINLM